MPHLQHLLDQLFQAALSWNLPIDRQRDQRQLQLSTQGREVAPDLTCPLWIFTQKVESLFVEGRQTDLWTLQVKCYILRVKLSFFMHAAPQLYSSMQIGFSLLSKIMLYQCLCRTPDALLEAFGGHTWVFDWVLSGTSHRRTFWACLQSRGRPLSLGGSVEPLSPATKRHPFCLTAHSVHLKGHWEWKHREGLKAWSCLMKEWKLNLTCGSRGLFLEQLWSAEAAHGGDCDNKAAVN